MAREYTRQINLYIDGQKVKNSLKSIQAEMRKLVAEQGHMTIGSKEYVAQTKKIQALKGVIKQHNAQLQQTKRSYQGLNKMANAFNKYWQMGVTAVAGAVGFVMAFRKTAEAANEFEASLDNLSALTGLEGRELEWLGKQAKETSVAILDSGVRIRQSASDITQAYKKMGSQRPELLKDKEALHEVSQNAIILSEAAKMELDPAVSALATTMNQFNLRATESGRVINALSAGSKLGAGDIPYLTQAIEKSGTTMALMNLSVEDNIALVEAVAPKYAQASQAGNSLDKVLLRMKNEQIGYKDGVFDMNRALDELRHRFKQGESATDIFGERHAKMAEVLLQAQPAYNKYKEGVTGTAIALEQATKNTNNNETALAQAQNKVKLMYIEIGQKLAPALVKSTNGWNYMLKAMMALPQIIVKHRTLFIALGGALLALNAQLIKKIALSAKDRAMSAWGLAVKGKEIVLANAKGLLARTNILLTKKATIANKRAIVTQKSLNNAMKMNPIGAVILAITSLIAVYKYWETHNKKAVGLEQRKAKALEETKKANELLSESYDSIKGSIGELNTLSIQEKKDLQEKLNATIELAEAEWLLAQAKKDAVFDESNRVKWYQGIFTFNKEKIIEKGMKNASKATEELNDQVMDLSDRLNALKGQSNNLSDILNAESIGDQIGVETLTAMEEKLAKYNTALQNARTGSEDFARIQGKIASLETQMAKARGANLGTGKDTYEITAENIKVLRGALKDYVAEAFDADKALDDIIKQENLDLWNTEDFEPEADQLATNYLYWLESTYEGRKELLLQNLKDHIISYNEYADKIKAIDDEITENKLADAETVTNATMDMLGAVSSFQEARKAKELSNERLTDKQKEKIEKKYAKRQRAMASFETVIQGAIEVARINSNAGVNADLSQTLRIILTAAAVARTAGTLATIQASKYAKGKYPVLDPQGGRSYQSAFVGPVKTGLYKKPTLGLFSEEEPEIVIDGPTTRNLMTNFPEILGAIQNARFGQYASGLYPEGTTPGSDPALQQLMMQTISVMLAVKKSHERPAEVSFRSILDKTEEYQDIQQEVNM